MNYDKSMPKKNKKSHSLLKKIVLSFLSAIVLLAACVWLAFQLSPRPFVMLLNAIPQEHPKQPKDFQTVLAKTNSLKNITYLTGKKTGKLQMDIYYPKKQTIQGTIIWFHGGGFIGGDKAMLDYWGPSLASQGYSFVALNYSTAPDFHYPVPLRQANAAYRFLESQTGVNQVINLKNIIIGGDSAGAQIASQYAAIQTNSKLARQMHMKQLIKPSAIKAALLFCGPYDLKSLSENMPASFRKYVNDIGWAYIGQKNWQRSAAARQASTVDFVTKKYPATFLTDGNTASFETHARKMIQVLRRKNIYHESLFFSKSQYGKVNHEYQLDLNTANGQRCLHRAIHFLKKVVH
ncbi:MAG: alpha/beta hydrolase [Oenococcus sp.]|uniref:alpha/beta hydrolase n=2 Tax=Oenococcus sp. TaxID=1979414 RepID=UPI0039EA7E28